MLIGCYQVLARVCQAIGRGRALRGLLTRWGGCIRCIREWVRLDNQPYWREANILLVTTAYEFAAICACLLEWLACRLAGQARGRARPPVGAAKHTPHICTEYNYTQNASFQKLSMLVQYEAHALYISGGEQNITVHVFPTPPMLCRTFHPYV
jgi:hypothetical protein